ncbi:MAG: hypothetical protein V8T36_10690 [Ruthenibacterium lactatiformans]
MTDPIVIGFMVDKTNGRLGEEPSFHDHRKFDLDGVLILIMFFVGPQLPENFVLRLLFFHCSVCNLYHRLHLPVCCHQIGAVLHDERSKQRPTFAIFDSMYNTAIMTGLGMLVTMYLVPEIHGG